MIRLVAQQAKSLFLSSCLFSDSMKDAKEHEHLGTGEADKLTWGIFLIDTLHAPLQTLANLDHPGRNCINEASLLQLLKRLPVDVQQIFSMQV